jgi:hypothetical protein
LRAGEAFLVHNRLDAREDLWLYCGFIPSRTHPQQE